jgi:hypothetical protein
LKEVFFYNTCASDQQLSLIANINLTEPSTHHGWQREDAEILVVYRENVTSDGRMISESERVKQKGFTDSKTCVNCDTKAPSSFDKANEYMEGEIRCKMMGAKGCHTLDKHI